MSGMRTNSVARLLLLAAFAALAVACGGAVTSAGSPTAGGTALRTVNGTTAATGKAVPGDLAVVPGTGAAVNPPVPAPNDVVPPIPDGPRVIRTAQLAVEVRNGTFDRSIDNVFGIATGLGGYISGSSATTDNGALRSGSITFQVPSDKFDEAIREVRDLGTVQNLVIGGQDVSAQYVDLQARLANEQAQRDAMLALLGQAKTVQEIIQVQNQLGQITGQIEQLKGQIAYFDHATTYSTVSVSIHEAAVAFKPQVDSWGFATALSQGLHGFVSTLDYILVGVGYAGPVLVLLGLAGIAWRLRRRFGLGAQATL
jgi:Domain of unknown function (DUF4349)